MVSLRADDRWSIQGPKGSQHGKPRPIMNPDGAQLALVVGHYKSGSSWLDNILSGHPWIRGLSETHVFRYTATMDLATATTNLFTKTAWSEGGLRYLPRQRLARWLKPIRRIWRPVLDASERPTTLLDLGIADQFRLKRYLLQSKSKEEYCRRFFGYLHDRLRPRGYLVEKTPNNILYVPYVRSIFPAAKLMAVYRDGRDVVVSDRFFRNIQREQWSFTDSVQYWRKLMEAQLEYADRYGIFTCSYESLLQEGERVVRDLLNFLRLPAEGTVIRDMLHRASFEFITGRKPGVEDQGRFYRKGVSGDWQHRFTSEDKRVFKELAGDLLIKLGYERDHNW
jgi:hypothetical protein